MDAVYSNHRKQRDTQGNKQMKAPHIGNLRKRAKALGYEVTKINGPEWTGYSEYVIHPIGASYDDETILSLYGIRVWIAIVEKERNHHAQTSATKAS